jgi:uncharacterized protein (TIGR02217 family)
MPWTGPIFPSLPGITYPVKRSPTWSAVKNDALSGKRVRYSLFTYPIYAYEVPFSFLRSDTINLEWQTLVGFINSLAGAVQMFGFTDPDDNAVSNQRFGTGDGSTLGPFQLVRALGSFVEPVFLLNGAPTVQVAGVTSSAYTVDGYGRVTFTAGNAPANGAALTWSGSYFMACRLDDDVTDFSKFMVTLWEVKSLKFSSEKLP